MSKQTITLQFVVLAALVAFPSWICAHKLELSTWATTVDHGHERKTVLQFYFHDISNGPNVTAVRIAPGGPANGSFVLTFGDLFMADEQLTLGPDPKSTLLGRAQGLYGSASKEDSSFIMALTYTFYEGVYNGSSVSILGRNPFMEPVREMAVVGGTGLFRMARGYAVARAYSFNLTTFITIVGYNITVFHP